ncbi:aldehyde dehydrogenase family protein [Rubrivirga litoralis]|uniref:Aldehyde dehydrogenase family protein n=1 Tax=Rubrivirga litoralis TaxID=3075598 RepID=A0ABU3BV91_9BACT|nr:aldehyde dehydrogenase family protein [Rubrivirga sp. F394]MDT0633207.1 aldehyde dehydrogenase family protein [Rubrivirga sp. F394]
MADDTTFQNYIGGQWVDAQSGETFESRNPARTSDLVGHFPLSGGADVEAAVAAAKAAFETWRLVPAPKRGEILKRVGDLLTERKNEIAFEMTREMGKPHFETKGDVQEAIDTAYYAMTMGRQLFGHTVPSEMNNKFNMTVRRPIGVCGLITAWNFPVAVPTWKMFPAILSGNTVVFKPSEDAPHSGMLLVKVMEDAGVPPGVVNLVQGAGATGQAIVEHDDVAAISFTGSSETGAALAQQAAADHKRVSLEMGGKNPAIVMEDADLDLAMEGLIWGAYGTTGQRCTATSRLIVHEDVHDELVERVIAKAKELRLGYGNDAGVDVGPLINQKALDKVAGYMDVAREDGASIALGGAAATGDGLDDGFFFQPTLFTNVTRDMRVAREEIFGPVLSVIKVSSFDEAIDVANDVKYGLSSAVYTRDIARAFQALRDIDAGITYINGPTIGAEAHMSFGGVKATGNGHREGGWEVYDFYTETKTCYIDFSGGLQRAQIDNYDD